MNKYFTFHYIDSSTPHETEDTFLFSGTSKLDDAARILLSFKQFRNSCVNWLILVLARKSYSENAKSVSSQTNFLLFLFKYVLKFRVRYLGSYTNPSSNVAAMYDYNFNSHHSLVNIYLEYI